MDKEKIRRGVDKYNRVNSDLLRKVETYERIKAEKKEAFNNNKHVIRLKKMNDFIFKYVTVFTLGAISPLFLGYGLDLTASLFMGIAAIMTVLVGKNIIKTLLVDAKVRKHVKENIEAAAESVTDKNTDNVISIEEAKIKKARDKEEDAYDKAESI